MNRLIICTNDYIHKIIIYCTKVCRKTFHIDLNYSIDNSYVHWIYILCLKIFISQ